MVPPAADSVHDEHEREDGGDQDAGDGGDANVYDTSATAVTAP
jgi:hypothetical protein